MMGRDDVEAIRAIAKGRDEVPDLVDDPDPEPILEQTGFGKESDSGSGGIRWPRTEPNAAVRTYHPVVSYVSAGGAFVWNRLPINRVYMVDQDGLPVDDVFAAP